VVGEVDRWRPRVRDSTTSSGYGSVEAAEGRSTTVLTRGTLVIDVEACKGCDLCIGACPPGVLQMSSEVNTRGYRFPLLRPGCTGCKACSQICPDFVFQVYKYDTPLDVPSSPPTGTLRQ
jgi:2-oxoglutarate ferredoxin oxidoreductase subunit delta